MARNSTSAPCGGAVFDPIASMLEPDVLSLQQYLDGWRGAGTLEPERKLLLAILQDAVELFQKYAHARGGKPESLFRETQAWFFEDNHEWPCFSLVSAKPSGLVQTICGEDCCGGKRAQYESAPAMKTNGCDQRPRTEVRMMNRVIDLNMGKSSRRAALKFVILVGVMSFFADFTYEGARSITGPFLATLGANGTIVGIVAGLGELLGYGLRLVSGTLSEKTQKFWPITFFGYFIQMSAVPLLTFAGSWQMAALLIIIERVGKAIRNPPRDVMLSHAAKEMGYGWGFGVHEALDQFGALFGPLVVFAVLARQGDYRTGFAVLVIPALMTYSMLIVARVLYPKPEDLEADVPDVNTKGLPAIFWVYLAGAALVAAGFADFQLIAYHFEKADALNDMWIPVMYSIAMAVSGTGSLLFGRMFDRAGIGVLIPLTLISAVFAPLVFLGGFWPVIVGSALWGLGMGVHESIVPAAVATMVPPQRRPSAYGLFTAGYGLAWFIGSAIMGILYDFSIVVVVIFCIVLQLAAVPLFLKVKNIAPRRSAPT